VIKKVRTHTHNFPARGTEDNKQKHLNASNVQKINCCQCARGTKNHCSLLSEEAERFGLGTQHPQEVLWSFSQTFGIRKTRSTWVPQTRGAWRSGFSARNEKGLRLNEPTASANQLKKVLRAGRLV